MSVTVSISAVQTHTPDVDADTIRTVTVHRRWYRSLWASTALAVESPTGLFVTYCLFYVYDIMIWITRSLDLHSDNIITTTVITSHWLERSFCRLPFTLLVFSRADHSNSQVLTTFYVVFLSTFYWRLASKASQLIRPPLFGPTAMTSHAAVTSDARNIQITSQNICICC